MIKYFLIMLLPLASLAISSGSPTPPETSDATPVMNPLSAFQRFLLGSTTSFQEHISQCSKGFQGNLEEIYDFVQTCNPHLQTEEMMRFIFECKHFLSSHDAFVNVVLPVLAAAERFPDILKPSCFIDLCEFVEAFLPGNQKMALNLLLGTDLLHFFPRTNGRILMSYVSDSAYRKKEFRESSWSYSLSPGAPVKPCYSSQRPLTDVISDLKKTPVHQSPPPQRDRISRFIKTMGSISAYCDLQKTDGIIQHILFIGERALSQESDFIQEFTTRFNATYIPSPIRIEDALSFLSLIEPFRDILGVRTGKVLLSKVQVTGILQGDRLMFQRWIQALAMHYTHGACTRFPVMS